MITQHNIYFAGEIFDHKHLVGNALLASYIDAHSQGRYRCILPQDLKQTSTRASDIRNQDLRTLMECDLALFNFDGADLDSGTVVEYVYAKMLDIPSVILRTDFRHAGDQNKDGDPWNLMASFYPRTRILHLNAMQQYQEASAEGGSAEQASARFQRRIAAAVIELLDAVRNEPPVLRGTQADIERIYRWGMRFPGGGLADETDFAAHVQRVVQRKIALGLLRSDDDNASQAALKD